MAVSPRVAPTPPRPQPEPRVFSVDEANRALVFISRVVADVIDAYAKVVRLRRRLEHRSPKPDPLHRRYEAAISRLGDLVDELHLAGVEIRDFERGEIEFPAMHDGRGILLCWSAGDAEVSRWHELDADDTSIQPIETLTATRAAKAA